MLTLSHPAVIYSKLEMLSSSNNSKGNAYFSFINTQINIFHSFEAETCDSNSSFKCMKMTNNSAEGKKQSFERIWLLFFTPLTT